MTMQDEDYCDDDYEDDPIDEAIMNCSGHYYQGVFVCGAVASEYCDWECPFSKNIGKRRRGA